MLGVGLGEPSHRRQGDPVADASEHVLKIAPLLCVVEHFGGRDRQDAVLRGAIAHAPFLRPFAWPAVARDHHIQPIAERLAQLFGHEQWIGTAGDEAPVAAPQRNQPLGAIANLAPRHL